MNFTPLLITHPLNGLLMILMPLGLGVYLSRRFGPNWRLWGMGALTFILSQVGHIPFNILLTSLFSKGILPSPPAAWMLPFNALVLGLSSGLWEEFARYCTYRWWAKDARSWDKGIWMGAGHGGVEAIILGALVLYGFFQMFALRGADLASLVPTGRITVVQQQVDAYWSYAWYIPLVGVLERCFAIFLHLACSVLVLQVFVRGHLRWVWFSVGLHALVNGAAVVAADKGGMLASEVTIGILSLLSIFLIFKLRPPKQILAVGESKPEQPQLPVLIHPLEETPENYEQTRYN